jgi:hypothetical protein
MWTRLASGVFDNAMLYKDITQWLRNRTFLVLFIGLLALGEVVSVICMSVPGREGAAGPLAFRFLTALVSLYGLVVVATGFTATAREFSNRTFELYELAGMSLERMVLGKAISIMAQFYFGFFCIVPFMFFAFLLGGLDFGLIGRSSLNGVVWAPVGSLVALALAFSVRFKRISVLGRIMLFFLVLWIVPGFILRLAMGAHFMHPVGAGTGTFSVFSLTSTDDIVLRVALYVQFCLWLFYVCCNSIAPPQDSREQQVKFLTFSLILNWAALIACSSSSIPVAIVAIPLFIAFCLVGAVFFPNRMGPPPVVVNRARRTRGFTVRCFNWWFAPGAMGTLRTLLLFYLFSVVLYQSVDASWASWGPAGRDDLALASLPLEVPFFLFLSPILLMPIRFVRQRYKVLRAFTICWWALVGVGLLLLFAMYKSNDLLAHGSAFEGVRALTAYAAFALSPVSSWTIGIHYHPGFEDGVGPYRHVLGALGMAGLYWTAQRCIKAETKENESVAQAF